MSKVIIGKTAREIAHSKHLADNNPELVWGWGTRAGRLRAVRRANLITKGAGLRPNKKVLEIGCGTGLFTELFAQTGAHILAVDISDRLLNIAKERKLPSKRIRFLAARFEDCNLEGPFDAVIGSSILHHLDLKVALSKIYTLLKPGGFMCFAEPNYLNPQVFIERKFSFWRSIFWYVSPDEIAFLRWKLNNLLVNSGFESSKIVPFDWLHPATPEVLIESAQWAGLLLEKIPIMKEFSGSLLIRCRRPISS